MKEVILITGSSRGIGAATAMLAARHLNQPVPRHPGE